ncbi:MAG: hypothetical protein ACI4KC_08830 [Gemmiger sp.]
MKLLNLRDARALGCDMTPQMAQAVEAWDSLFYLADQTPHSLKMAQSLTGYMATLATSEMTFSTGTGARADWLQQQCGANLTPHLFEAVQLAGVGGMAAVKPFVENGSLYAEVIPRGRIFPERWGPNYRLNAGYFTDFDKIEGDVAVVKVEHFDLRDGALTITNKAYRLKTGGLMGEEVSLTDVPRWAALEPEVTIHNVNRPHFGLLRMPMLNTVDASPYPVSLYANALDTLRQLDATYGDFVWERETGKRRMILDRTAAMRDPVNGKPPIPFREMASDFYMTIDMPDEKPWDDYTPDFRFDAYKTSMETLLRLLEMQVGFSAGTFAIEPRTGRVTATQVISEDRTTYNTIKAIQDRGLTTGLLDVLYWFDVYATLYSLAPAGAVEPAVSFGDSIFEDTGVEFQRRMALAQANYLRPELVTAWYFGVDEEKARQMMPAADTLHFGDA